MNRRQIALGALLAGLLATITVYLYLQATPYTETIDHGPSPEAQANPYLAAEYFLRQQGLSVTHANSLETLPPLPSRRHSLLLLGERVDMTPAQVEQVLARAHAGGRLLLVAEALWDAEAGKSADLLLDRVQVQQSLSKYLKDPPPEAATDPYPSLTKLCLENEQAPAYASFDPQFHLEDPHNLAQAWADSALATHMMQLPYGEGLITVITVITDAELWKNSNIGRYDNAWLLWYLNTGHRGHPAVRHRPRPPADPAAAVFPPGPDRPRCVARPLVLARRLAPGPLAGPRTQGSPPAAGARRRQC